MISKSTHPDTYALAQAVPARFVKPPPPGKRGSYIPHYTIEQAVIAAVGVFDWELVEILRGSSSGTVNGKTVTAENVIVGAVYRMTVQVDGRTVWVEEPGQCEHSYKEPDDGARLKKASSDALKRCGMRLGKGLHLWVKDRSEFFLPEFLRSQDDEPEPAHVDEYEIGLEADDETPGEAPHVVPAQAADDPPGDTETPTPNEPAENVSEADAVENLASAGLIPVPDGQTRLPSGKIIPTPSTEAEWVTVAKQEFVSHCGSVDAGKAFFVSFARTILEGTGIDEGAMTDEMVLESEYGFAEIWSMLEDLAA